MKKFLIIVLVCLFLFPASVLAADSNPAEKLSYEFDNATCNAIKYIRLPTGTLRSVPVLRSEGIENADALFCKTKYPLMTDRLASYGSIQTKVDRSGISRRTFDTKDEKKLTAAGRQLSTDLMALKQSRLFAISMAPVSYNTITIVPYDLVPIEDIVEQISVLFGKAAKIDAAAGE